MQNSEWSSIDKNNNKKQQQTNNHNKKTKKKQKNTTTITKPKKCVGLEFRFLEVCFRLSKMNFIRHLPISGRVT